MARRRLEAALQVGKDIENKSVDFTSIGVRHEISVSREHKGVYSLQFNYDSSSLAVGLGSGCIQIYDPKTGRLDKTFKKPLYLSYPVMSLRYNPKRQDLLYAANAKGVVLSCKPDDESCAEIISEKNNEINALDFSADGFSFATAGKDLSIRIYDTNTNKLHHEYDGYHPVKHSDNTFKGHSQRIFAVRYHPENNYVFLTGGWDNCVKVWDSRTRDGVERLITGPHICGDSLDVKGYKMLTGSWTSKNALQIWEHTSGSLERTVPVPCGSGGEFLYCSQFCDNDAVLAGGSGTNSVQAINSKTGQCLGDVKFSKPVQAMDSTQGGRCFAVGGMDEHLKIGYLQ
ncbi:PREDICTED: uncharacterized WD repeat-containing protein all2124-like [Priapulus caudatus]|uniref:Uncharacterized WD repeat-containing protein all2124-like n=1 Tax=Priapulus caudatus TaxID=37621 RepID=A0ABM1EPG8_PRICU|nr:PREDICTED: uncharacterized WD repeat-containing protein all2124-like [Priapulus caudatus]